MSWNNILVLLLSCYMYSASAEDDTVFTTTKSYDLNVPGSSPIRIIEGEPLWNKATTAKPLSSFEHRSFTTIKSSTNLNSPINNEQDENSAEFTHSALRDFLNSYAEKVTKEKPPKDYDEEKIDEDQDGKVKKSWSLMNLREHNHPYDDKKGWVTLEPVPWSLSKISKWQSKPKPIEKPWDKYPPNDRPFDDDVEYSNDRISSWHNPQENRYQYNTKLEKPEDNNYEVYYKPTYRPPYSKPSAIYGQSVHVHTSTYHRDPVKVNNIHRHDSSCNHNHEEDVGIITDGKPSNFPSNHYDTNRRVGTELHTETHPFMDEGEWVLLSTTKGYKIPKNRQRSLGVNPDSIGTHRSVRLTVLPPVKGSKVNMTTSHGGLLQVDSTFETVDQAQKKFIKLQKVKTKPKRPAKLTKKKPITEISSTIATMSTNTGTDSNAVLAAVGAGMIPATMAMLVPIAMHGKKRRKRASSSVEITPPYYL